MCICRSNLMGVCSSCRVSCILEASTGKITISCHEVNPEGAATLQVASPCKLFPTLVITPSHEQVADILFAPESGCQPVAAAVMPHGVPSSGNLLPQMKLTVLTHASWHQLEERIAKRQVAQSSPYASDPTLSLSTMFSVQTPQVELRNPLAFSFPRPASPGTFPSGALPLPRCSRKQLMCATLPQEDQVIGFTELVEHPQLLAFHLESLRTLRATCLHDNELSARQVRTREKHFLCWRETETKREREREERGGGTSQSKEALI